jgi:enoyl-CoA hydratase/carnithine racemase
MNAPEMLECEGKYFLWASAQTDAREGVISFLEKRPPQWKLRASVDVPDL